MRTFCPSIQPSCGSACVKAVSRLCPSASLAGQGMSTPMRRMRSDCCARAANGHATIAIKHHIRVLMAHDDDKKAQAHFSNRRHRKLLVMVHCRCPLWVISGHFAVQPRQRGAVANMVEETTSQKEALEMTITVYTNS